MTKQIDELMQIGMANAFSAKTKAEKEKALRQALEAALKPGVLVGSINKAHLKQTGEPWCKEVLLYSPNNDADFPDSRVTVYTAAPPAKPDVKPDREAFEQWTLSQPWINGHWETAKAWAAWQGGFLAATPAQTPAPPRLTLEEIDKAWGSPFGVARAIESAVRKQWAEHFRVNDE